MVDWNIAPEIFSLKVAGFNLAPRWYGLSFVLGFFLGERYVSIYMLKAGFTKKDVSKKVRNKINLKQKLKSFLSNHNLSFLEVKIANSKINKLPRPKNLLKIKNNFIG